MGKKQKGSKVEAKVAKSDPPKNESNKKKFKKDKKNKQPKNVNGEKDFQIKSPKDSPTTENNSKKKKFKKDKKNQQQENVNEEKDLQIKKNIQANPQLLKQELEVFVKNLNKEAKLQDYFVKKDDDVSDIDDDPLTDDEQEEPIQSDEISSTSTPIVTSEAPTKKENTAEDTVKNEKKKKKKEKSKKSSENEQKVEEVEEESEKIRDTKQKEVDDSKVKADYGFLKDPKALKRTQSLVKSGVKWYEINAINNDDTDESDFEKEYWIQKMQTYATKLFEQEVTNVAALNAKNSEKQWLKTVLKSGTLTDKISAYSVLLQENPVANLASLEQLISMISLKSRRPCLMAIDALLELFTNFLLPNDRKLKLFQDHPFKKLSKFSSGNKDTRDKILILWHFEAKLKECYKTFLTNLGEVSKDTIEKTRMKVMTVILQLLTSCPEQEQELLSRLINKLGDPVRAVASKAIHLIGQLLEAHSAMTPIVLEEIEHLLYRPNVNAKAQYYGICCLTQLMLDDSNPEMANHMIKIYFSFFKASVKKGEVDTKMVSALLTGVNRAYPYAKLDQEGLDQHKETLFKVVHITTNFNVTLQAFMLLYQVQGESEAQDRFYSAFYRKMLDPNISVMNKHAQFFNLVFKILKNDPNSSRMIAISKRLLQSSLQQAPHLMCSTLYLLSELIKIRPQDAKFLEQIMENSKNSLFQEDDSDVDDDYKVDIESSDDEIPTVKKTTTLPGSSWVHKNVTTSNQNKPKNDQIVSYDPQHRNPAHAGANKTNHWELSLMRQHFHPSVELFAQTIMEGKDIKYTGDPLQDFTLMRFLDRFVFRNPKKDVKINSKVFNKRNAYRSQGVRALAPDSNEYLSKDIGQIPIDERFIYNYLKEKRSKEADAPDSDDESVNSEDFNEAIKVNVDDKDLDFASNIENIDEDENDEDEDEDQEDDDEDGQNDSDEENVEFESLDEESGSDSEKDLDDDFTDAFDPVSMTSKNVKSKKSKSNVEAKEEEEEDFDDDFEDEFDPVVVPPTKKAKMSKKNKATKSGQGQDLHSLLASADEFSALIDENAQAGQSTDTLGAIFNRDQSHAKQMKWETKRLKNKKK